MLHRQRTPQPSLDELLRYCSQLEWKHAPEVGYLAKPALEKYALRGQLLPAYENGDLCGYILFNDTPGQRFRTTYPAIARIHQAVIQYDARRILHGTQLVQQAITRAARNGFRYIDCYVTDGIPANAFWAALGFQLVGTRPGGRKRKRTLNHWIRQLDRHLDATHRNVIVAGTTLSLARDG